MKKRLLIVTSILLLSTSILGGCGKKAEATEIDSTQDAEQEEKKEVEVVWDVLFDRQEDENNNEYAVITAIDKNGNEIWKYMTGIAEAYLIPGEIKGNFYCYEEGNTTIALNLSDGTPTWTFKNVEVIGEEYAVITVLDEKGNEQWSYTTPKIYENSALFVFEPIGILGEYFYYMEHDIIVALNSSDGTLAWKNDEFGYNYAVKTVIGTDGTLYFSAPDVAFFAVDSQGVTSKKIDSFDNTYYWTSEIVCYNDYVEVTRTNSSLVPAGSVVYRVELSDYSYEISKPDERVSHEKLTVYTTGQVSDVQFERVYTTEDSGEYEESGEHGVFTAVDSTGNIIWEYTTDKFMPTELDTVCPIGIKGSQYYLSAGGTIVALNLSDGSKIWENDECGAYGISSAIGEDGTIYLCGYYSVDFMAIDSNGNTLKIIDTFDKNHFWPYEVKCFDQYVEVTFEADNDNNDEEGGVFRVYLDDFSYELVE